MSDLISRQIAIDAIEKYLDKFDCIDANFLDGLKTTKKILNDLPSAQPEQQWIPCSERLPRYNERVLVKHTHFVNVDTAFLCHTHLWDYWRFDHVIPKEPFVGKRDMWMPIPSWKNIEDEYNENQCEQCIYYHRENNTCQLKKCSTLGGEGYVTSLDRKFCEYCKNKDEE